MDRNNRKGIVFARYLWLYGEIVSKGPISFETLSLDWTLSSLNETGKPLPHKTFENHRKAVEDMFGISIECNRANNTYNIEPTALQFSRAIMDMLNRAIMFNRVQTDPHMHRFIRIEPNYDDSSMLFTVIDALAEGRVLTIRYRHNYDAKRETMYRVKPIAIKQFGHRWYLIAELHDEGTCYSFPFDRILNIAKGEMVTPSKMDVDEMFANAFGIIRESSVKPEIIKLKVDREQANYFISRPLHKSQKTLEITDRFVTFSLRLCPTYDFVMELLSHGEKVEVLEPQSLRQRIAEKIRETLKLYS